MASDGDLMGRRSDDRRRSWWLTMLADGASPDDILGPGGERPVREVMSAPIITISAGAPVQDIAEALQAHRIKRLPVVENGRVLGVISRVDLLCVVESVPKDRLEEEGGAGILAFFESLIGGASLRGVAERGGGSAETAPHPPKPPVFSAHAFRSNVRTFKAESSDKREAARREAQLDRRRQIKALLDHHVSAQLWRELLEHAELAARGGEQELMLLRFPSDLCIDGGRKIDVVEKGWEETLRGEAAEIYDRWRKELKPQGFGLAARIRQLRRGGRHRRHRPLSDLGGMRPRLLIADRRAEDGRTKDVADAAHRSNERATRIEIDLLAQPRDERVDRPIEIGPGASPQIAQERAARKRPAGLAEEGRQEIVFRRGEIDMAPIRTDAASRHPVKRPAIEAPAARAQRLPAAWRLPS